MWMRLTERVREFIPKAGCCMLTTSIVCIFLCFYFMIIILLGNIYDAIIMTTPL